MVILQYSSTLQYHAKNTVVVLYIVQIVLLWYFEKYHGTENDVTRHLHGTCPKYFLVVIIWYFHGNEIDVPWLYHRTCPKSHGNTMVIFPLQKNSTESTVAASWYNDVIRF